VYAEVKLQAIIVQETKSRENEQFSTEFMIKSTVS